MPVRKDSAIGLRGINLGADPAQLAEGALTVADGIRFLESGAAHSRGGRVRAGLSFPDEGIGVASTYTSSVEQFQAPGRVRGLAPYYDQRIYPTTGATTATLPQRLNWIYKANGRVKFNEQDAADGTGVLVAGSPGGDLFDDPDTRAKFVVYGDRAFIVDESTRPKVFQRLPAAAQTYLSRVKYDVRSAGILWPTATNQKPAVTTVAGADTIPAGLYKFRIMLENKFGTTSSPSMPGEKQYTTDQVVTAIKVDWSALVAGWPETPAKVRIYVQFAAYSTVQIDPSDYLFWKSLAPGGTNSANFERADFDTKHNKGSMATDTAAPPRLRDFLVIKDVAFGISSYDTIYRESFISEGGQRIAGEVVRNQPTPPGGGLVNNRPPIDGSTKLYENTEIKQERVDPSYLFWSRPGEPQYMENKLQVGKGTEIGIGLAELGEDLIVFTNVAIYVFDVRTVSLKRAFSKVGCLSRDSIVETEQGIRFIASDGVPRLFNGATVDEVTTELLPIFDRDDYHGAYARFDKQYAGEVQAAYGKRKFYMNYPTSSAPGQVPSKPTSDTGTSRNLAVGDGSRGATLWSIDRQSLDYITWLGRESRMLGIDPSGYFYFIEEGLVDQLPASSGGVGTSSIFFDLGLRRLAAAGGTQGYFSRMSFDIDTQGQDVQVALTVDDNPDLSLSFVVNTARRDEFKTWLPAFFMGRYMDIRISGSTTSRVAVYPVLLDSAPRGEF